MIAISLRQLEVFVGIATRGTVRAAAEHLHLTQPAVSMALTELERQLSTLLFDRDRGRLHLSARGRELLPQAREILERVQDFQYLASDRTRQLAGELRIGASNTIGNYLVGDLLGNFIARHPQVNLQVRVENTRDIIRDLLNHELDAACVEGTVNHPRLQALPWRDDTLAVHAAPGHPLAARRRLQAGDFEDVKWILREPGSAMRTLAEQAMALLPPGQIFLELGQVEAIKQAVIAGLGLSFLPDAATRDALATGRLVRLSTPFLPLQRRFSVMLHRSRYQPTVLGAFLASLALDPGELTSADD
ncbi:MAG: LysR substrate-binding domain-containing protein [Castellaniella sp.]